MSDSDEEFQKFLQESISSSAGSYISELSRSRKSSAGFMGGGSRWYDRGEAIDESASDKELEEAAQSWLKTTGPLVKTQTTSVNITLPTSGDFSKDSLEVSKEDSHASPSLTCSSTSSKRRSDLRDTFSETGSSSLSKFSSTVPGLDTLEENADKELFFAELEQNRTSRIDYSELNRQLENTARSSLPDNSRAPPKEDDYSEQYDEDFDTTVTSHSKTHLSSDSSSSLTLTNDTIRQTNKDHVTNKSELTQSAANPTLLNESGSSITSSHSQKRLLDLSNTHRPFAHLTEEGGFNPSPIPLHHALDVSGRINKDKENLSESAHSSLDDHDRRLSLTPIHPKGLAPGRGKTHTVPIKRTLVDNVSLSPLHKTEKPEVDISASQLRKQPPSSSSLSPVRESLLNTRLQLSSTKQSVANFPQDVLVPSLLENPSVLSRYESHEQREDNLLDSNVGIDAQPRDQSALLNDSMLTEFNELQDALKAAGLPQIAEKPLLPENEESQLNATSPTATCMSGGKMSPTLQNPEGTLDSVITAVQKLPTVDQDLESIQTLRTENKTLEKAEEPLSTGTEHTSMPLETQLQENASIGHSPVPGIQSRPIHQQSMKPRSEQATDTDASKKSMLREALRVIASEELTSVSRGILYEDSRSRSGAQQKNGEFDRPNRTVHGGTHPVEVSVGQRTDNKLVPSKVSQTPDHKKFETSPLSKEAPKLTVYVPTGSTESGSKLMDELADILNSTNDHQEPSSSKPTSHTRVPRSRQSLKPPEPNHPSKKLPDNIRGPNRRPFQVSSRLYPGPKAPPNTLSTKQGGARTQKFSPGIPPLRKFKRVSRQKSPPADMVTRQSPPVEIVANRREGVCSRCAVENEETERWKKAWQEEKSQKEKLNELVQEIRTEAEERERQLTSRHQEEQSTLKQELYTLSIKLQELETNHDPRRLLASDRDMEGRAISLEEKQALRCDIQEQEVLMQGYQKENERLYSQLEGLRRELKSSQAQLFHDNQQLRKELLTGRSEREVEKQPQKVEADANSNQASAARIAQLEDKLEHANDKCSQLEKQVTQLKHSCSCLEGDVRRVTGDKHQLDTRVRAMVERGQLDDLATKHKLEVSRLMGKLEWYAENQTQLDKDSELLRSKDKEIAALKEKMGSLEATHPLRGSSRAKAQGAEARRVVQLESQVRELEKVIQKRFPNSLSALILASNREADTGDKAKTPRPADGNHGYLEARVRQLETLLEERERESGRSLRALQQRYTAMELAYEKQLAALKGSSSLFTVPGQPDTIIEREKDDDRENVLHCRTLQLTTDLEAAKSDNAHLKEKLAVISFEADRQRVQLHGKLAEAEARLTDMQHTAQEKLQRTVGTHKTTVDSLRARLAKEQSQSQTVQLTSQLATKEATILHLRERIDCLEFNETQLTESKHREDQLSQQIKLLSDQLVEAKRHHAPEMHHFLSLQAKIAHLEERCAQYQDLMHEKWSSLQQPVTQRSLKEVENKWKTALNAKDAELDRFRQELDTLLGTLQVLQEKASIPQTLANH